MGHQNEKVRGGWLHLHVEPKKYKVPVATYLANNHPNTEIDT